MERELSEMFGRKVHLRTAEELSRYFRADVIANPGFNMNEADRVRLRHIVGRGP